MVFSTGALVHAIACAPGAHKEGLNLPVIAAAAETVDGVCSAAIVGTLAAAPGRAFVDGALVVPVFVFGTDKVYFIDGHFLARCRAVVSNDGKVPRVIEAYGVGVCFAVLDRVIVLAGAPVYIGNILAFFF